MDWVFVENFSSAFLSKNVSVEGLGMDVHCVDIQNIKSGGYGLCNRNLHRSEKIAPIHVILSFPGKFWFHQQDSIVTHF